jgi:phosphopentomutase
MKRAFVIVLDSVGIGAAPDAADYGDAGANTLAHLADAVGGVRLPCLESLGLGNIPPLLPGGLPIKGVRPVARPRGHAGAMMELSRGKDTTTGHWEMAGLHLKEGFHLFPPGPPSFPPALVRGIEERTGRRIIGDKAASGTAIIEELGARHLRDGALIAYTSADSVLQIAAHEEVVPLPELYRACEAARALCNPLRVGRVIARPFTGRPGAFQRTRNRRDFSYPLPEPTILDRLAAAGVHTVTVGKLDDIFNRGGIAESHHLENSRDAMDATLRLARARREEFVFANLIDFDMLYGHRRDAAGYARALVEADTFTGELTALLHDDELLFITADHGNDPTFRGTDHTREFVPLLVFSPTATPGASLGIRHGFFDLAQSVASYFGVAPMPRGVSFHPLTSMESAS